MPLRKWRVIARARPTQWPTTRIARGRSLGPMTTSATTRTRRNSLGAISNTAASALRPVVLHRLQVMRRIGIGIGLRLQPRRRPDGLILLRHPLLEAFDALGDVAHQVGKTA